MRHPVLAAGVFCALLFAALSFVPDPPPATLALKIAALFLSLFLVPKGVAPFFLDEKNVDWRRLAYGLYVVLGGFAFTGFQFWAMFYTPWTTGPGPFGLAYRWIAESAGIAALAFGFPSYKLFRD